MTADRAIPAQRTASGPAGRTVHTLASPPSLLPAYVAAALPTLPGRGGAHPGQVPPVTLRLEGVVPAEADVAAYCDLVGTRVGERLPVLYPHLLGFGLQLRLMTDAAFPFPAMGLVHVTNEVVARRRLPLGAPLEVSVHAEGVFSHPKGALVDLVTEVGCEGEVAWLERSSYLRRGPAGDGAPSPTREPVEGDLGVPLTFSASWRLRGDLGRRYAGVAGDVNPIHLHPLTARAFGFPRAIAHGLWSAAAVAAAVESRTPDAVRFVASFRRPVLLPGTVRLFTAVGDGRVRAELRGREGKDTVHLAASFDPLD